MRKENIIFCVSGETVMLVCLWKKMSIMSLCQWETDIMFVCQWGKCSVFVSVGKCILCISETKTDMLLCTDLTPTVLVTTIDALGHL